MKKEILIEPNMSDWPELCKRPELSHAPLLKIVQEILDDVRLGGDEAVRKYTARFDKALLQNLKVEEHEFEEANRQVDTKLKKAIGQAKQNIEVFHRAQQEQTIKIETSKEVFCWRRSVAIENVGLYIPGGTAPLFSTLLMLGIPALVAGCQHIVVCTPCDASGKVHPAILYTAGLLGIKQVHKIGGVQAIAALAYGTETVAKADKIFGPGNQYVTCAKQLVSQQGVAIDMLAGPSELALYADERCIPAYVAADLLSQAEHGPDSQVLLVAGSEGVAEAVLTEIDTQLARLPRKEIAQQALNHSRFVVISDPDRAFGLLNQYAPEHLIIASDNAEALAANVRNAGSVFLGNYSPESAGDYAAGTNHTLPTNGYAKAWSGLSVDSFVKKITFQQISEQGLRNIGEAVETMAAAEGLEAHRNAVAIRLKSRNNEN